MNQHPENHPPPTGLALAGDAAAEVRALRKQVEECEAHNSDLHDDLVQLREWVQGEIEGARKAIKADPWGQDPKVRLQAFNEMWNRIKPVS